jgi:acylphosphatase
VLVGRRYVVTGRVQRVGFRFFVHDAAARENISGYVRNQHDGSVEIVAEGDLDAIVRFEQAVRRGPSGARVDDVITTESPASGRFAGFSVMG